MSHLSILGVILSFSSFAGFGQTLLGTATIGPPPNLSSPSRMIVNPASNKAYLFGGNMVDVIDLGAQRLLGNISLPALPSSASLSGPDGVWVNSIKDRIYAFRGNQFVVIDGSTDAVVQTFSLPALLNSAYGPITYNTVSNRFYIGEISSTSPNGGEVRVVDETSFTTLATIPAPNVNGGVPPSERPEQILVNPATNRVYVFYQVSGAQILDGSMNAIVASATCTTTCNGLAFPPGDHNAMINPADHSVWVAMSGVIPGPTGGEDGANGPAGPPFTIFRRIDGTTNAVSTQFQVFGRETEVLGIDPGSGLIYMMATDLPTVPNPTSTSPVISAIEAMLVVLDPNQTTATFADPSPMRRVTVDGTELAGTGTPFTCGNGFQAFEPIGLDLSGGYIFWRCDATTKSFSSIVVSRLKFTDLGNVDYSQFVGQLATGGSGQISGHAIPAGISKDFDFTNNQGPAGTSLFYSGSDNLFFIVNPAVPALGTVPLGARPAGVTVDSATQRAFVTDLTSKVLSIVDLNSYSLLLKTPGPGGPFIAGNGAGQFVLAGPSDPVADPAQNNGAFLFNEASGGIQFPLQGAATGAVAVNAATNVAYLADGNRWIAVELNTGSRLFAVTDLTASGSDTCQMTGISVSKSTNQVFVAGHCAAGGNTLAVFDGSHGSLIATVNVDAVMQTAGRLIVNPNTNRVYVEAANPAPLSVMQWSIEVFDGATLTHLSSIADRKGPLAVNTMTSVVYAANSGSGASAIDGLAPEQISTFGGNQLVSALAVDEATNNVLIGSYNTYLGSCCTPLVPVYGVASGTLSVFHQDPATYLVQGLVTSGAVAQTGITVSVSGINGSFSQVTGPNGIFAGRLMPGVYIVTPSNPAFQFSPASQTITLGQVDQVVPTFIATPVFRINGVILTQSGAPVSGVSVTASGVNGSSSGVTNASGQYSIGGLPAGTYAVTAVSPANFYSPASQTVQINKADATAAQITVNPSLQITGFTLSSSLLGAGVQGTGTVTINELAPKGGISIALSSSDTKTIKPPTTVTIPAGSSTGTFSFTGSGTATVTLTATYSGALAAQPSSASAQISIVGVDTIRVVSTTWSNSTHVLNVSATGTNPNAVLTVTLASNGQTLGVMTGDGHGNFTLQTAVASKPSSVNVKSSLGGSTGQGVSVIP